MRTNSHGVTMNLRRRSPGLDRGDLGHRATDGSVNVRTGDSKFYDGDFLRRCMKLGGQAL